MSADAARREICIFPLNTVLFPDGVLPLKIFEQRYLEMTKACLRDNAPFGVCLIREGSEVGRAAVPHRVGTLATITQWDMPQLGVFQLETRGGARFRVLETQVSANGLVSGRVEILPEPAAEMDEACQQVLKAIIDKAGAQHFSPPLKLDDAAWVAYRLAEVLPLELAARQALLEMAEPGERFARLREILIRQAILTPGE
ncbi:MAG TPA: LON peptidase substrate-binding domain-containing protein [Burkholderiales bacterium]|nr:LON peptidase substrate-binding domain-containing protein [Burkholderiales bacterium]